MLQRVAYACGFLACLVVMAPAHGRPAMGRAGGGGRPAMPHPASRPIPAARPQMPAARPAGPAARPQAPHFQRPSVGAAQRPNLARPSLPNAGQRPMTQPAQLPRPGLGAMRPTSLPGATGRPAGAPGRPPGVASLPGAATRPGGGFATRPAPLGPGAGAAKPLGPKPGPGNRPATLPGNIGNGGDRPTGGVTRPTGPRPSRPGIGGSRPSVLPGDLGALGSGNRPGGWPDRPGRPGIGGNRPGIGDGNTIWNSGNDWFSGNSINVGGWNGGAWGYPGWGGAGSWSHAWNNGYVNPHYGGWYNGCWNGNWGGGWWAPFAVGAATWGVLSTATTWGLGYGAFGYGAEYVNPYYAAVPAAVVTASPYDYSQPVTVTNYVTMSDGSATAAAVAGGAATATDQLVDEALALFKAGDYAEALAGFDKALRAAPNDSVLHEARALALFALGRYAESAATLNAVLAAAPGMDWTTLSNLYGSVDAYTSQLRGLEEYCRSHRDDAGAHFVLAYHYLVGGHPEAALKPLRIVVAKQPNDSVAKRLLDGITPPADATTTTTTGAKDTTPASAQPGGEKTAPETDLVGTWHAGSGQEMIRLSITEDFTFTWKASSPGKPAVELAGTVETSADALALITEKAGTLAGKVASQGPDAFELSPPGAAEDAKPLLFRRQP